MNPPTATLAAGTAVTLGTAALIASTASYNLGAGILVGTAAGASVALVPGETGFRKIAGFLTGMVVAAGAYLLRAGALPDSALGAGIGIAAAFALITVISVATRGRSPLWASFAGIAAMAGAYETLHILDFAGLMANLPVAAAGVLLASAVGFTAASLFAPATGRAGASSPEAGGAEVADSDEISAIADLPATRDDREPVLV